MDVILHKFPTISEVGVDKVEEMYCMLLNKYRSGEKLDWETLDWIDYANNELISHSSKN